MKKMILCAGALLIGAVAMAQVGGGSLDGAAAAQASQEAALPGAPASANRGTTNQMGTSHKVLVQQAGTAQSVLTNQAGDRNQAFVAQTGLVGPGSGVENLAQVNQAGEKNQTTAFQQGDNNNVHVDQMGDENRSYSIQGVADQAEDNFLQVDQDGTKNKSVVQQTFDNSDAYVRQNGNDNRSDVNQNAGPNQTEGHFANVQQYDESNQVKINQMGAGARNGAYAWQQGENNKSQQIQTATDGQGGTGNLAGVIQGTTPTTFFVLNAASVASYNSLLGLDPSLTSGGFSGLSEKAVALQEQNGSGNSASISQYGATNAAGAGNFAEQFQEGDDNNAFMVQNAFGTTTNAGGNSAEQNQYGDRNEAAGYQNGRTHSALVNQGDAVTAGNDNIALTAQRGENNGVDIQQNGDSNVAHTVQHGKNNKILMTQSDGQSYSVNQNVGQFGANGGNQASIEQTGPGGTSVFGSLPAPAHARAYNRVVRHGVAAPGTPANLSIPNL
ncbi:hypothetical protein EAX61_01085 [Dokdonia sinensis]|uniref:Curlin n=1 Tax=Dokdonia sinensis TaxID=2479847 RepID=A0A3M0H2X1_9FLAO|nr:hypothetical protein [Dokdonia sinensis]RMB64006.1 hypothetical protein EAX61_01085 [Dokdonia sinensis]